MANNYKHQDVSVQCTRHCLGMTSQTEVSSLAETCDKQVLDMVVLALTHFALEWMALASHNGVGQLPVMGWSGYNAFMQVCVDLLLFFPLLLMCVVIAACQFYLFVKES